MNASIYVFGKFNNGYSQFPDDYSSSIFETFHKHAKSVTQLSIHREGNLMYYGYIRKLEEKNYIGFCIVLNGLMMSQINQLFALYENLITILVTKGYLIHFNNQGDIITNIEKLYLNQEEIAQLQNLIRFNLQKIDYTILPPVNYGKSKDSIKDFHISENIEDIIKSTYTNAYTFIYKTKDYNTSQFNSYKGVIARLNNEKNEIKSKYDDLQKVYANTLRQKKQMKLVILLVFALFIGSIIFFNTLEAKNKDIQSKQETIEQQSSENAKLEIEKDNLLGRHVTLQDQYRILKNAHDSLNIKFDNVQNSYEDLLTKYNQLNELVSLKQGEINNLQSKNQSLDKQIRVYRNNIRKKETDYQDLQKKYNILNQSLIIMENKYYSTKEGKKELRKRR